MNYSFKSNIKSKLNTNNEHEVHYFAFIENDLELIKHLKEAYSDKKIIFINENEFEKTINEINIQNESDLENPFILTNSKKIYKLSKDNNSFYFFKIKNEKSTKLYIDGDFDLAKIDASLKNAVDIIQAPSNFDIFNLIKKTGKKINKIIYINENKITVAFKVMGVWRVKEDTEIQMLFSFKNKNSIKTDEQKPIFFETCKREEEKIKLIETKVVYEGSDEEQYINNIKKLNWLIDDFFVKDVTDSSSTFYKFEKIYIDEFSDENFKFILNEMKDKGNYSGIDFEIVEEEETTKLKFDLGNILISNDEKGKYLLFNMKSLGDEGELISKFNHLKNTLLKVLTVKKGTGFKKFEIFKSAIGIILLIVLFYVTFNFIFTPSGMENSFGIMFGNGSYKKPWIYIIAILFTTNLFLPLLNSVIIEKFVFKREKLEFKRLWVYFIAAQLWSLGKFLTGNYFVAVFVWGWWLTKKLKVPGATVYSSFTSAAFIRAFMFMIVGGLFIIVGTTSFYTSYYDPSIVGSNTIISMSWVAYFFEWFSGMIMFLLLLSPTMQAGFTNLLMRFKFFGKPVSSSYLENGYKNVYIIKRDSIFRDLFKNKQLFYRYLVLVSMPIIIDGVETVMFFNLVESSVLTETNNLQYFNPTWNMISLTGIRLLANLVHMFPMLNLLPGGGIGFTEFSLKVLYEPIFIQHLSALPSGAFGVYTPGNMAEMTTFIQRFFNSYLKMSIVFVISTVTILNEIIRRGDKHV